MRTLDASDAEAAFYALLDRVEQGEEITITRNGKPVARLVPDTSKSDHLQARAAATRMIELRKGVTLGGISLKDLIDEGRR